LYCTRNVQHRLGVSKMPADKKAAVETVGSRVRQVVDAHHEGSVRKAAARLRMPHTTLAAIIHGEIPNPNAKFVTDFAAFHDISTDWLLTGKGRGPWWNGLQEVLEWDFLVIGLELHTTHPQLHRDLIDLPLATTSAARVFDVARFGGESRPHPDAKGARLEIAWTAGFFQASQLELSAWITFFTEWLEHAGKDGVRTALIRHAADVRKRFVRPRK
jgi:hypothetical protein